MARGESERGEGKRKSASKSNKCRGINVQTSPGKSKGVPDSELFKSIVQSGDASIRISNSDCIARPAATVEAEAGQRENVGQRRFPPCSALISNRLAAALSHESEEGTCEAVQGRGRAAFTSLWICTFWPQGGHCTGSKKRRLIEGLRLQIFFRRRTFFILKRSKS